MQDVIVGTYHMLYITPSYESLAFDGTFGMKLLAAGALVGDGRAAMEAAQRLLGGNLSIAAAVVCEPYEQT